MDVITNNPLSPMTPGTRAHSGMVTPSGASLPGSPGSNESTVSLAAAQQSSPDKMRGESVERAMSSIQSFVQAIRRDLNFDLDESSGRVVVKVTDSVSGDVIRQIPSEEALRLAESLEEVRSLLFKAEA